MGSCANKPATRVIRPMVHEPTATAQINNNIQRRMKALVRSSEDGSDVKVKEIPMPEVQPGHYLVKVEASPIHPVDQLQLQGTLFPPAMMPPPCKVGIEASGTVVKVGEGLAEKDWVGKRMTFMLVPIFPGIGDNLGWQEYIQVSKDYDYQVELAPKVSFDAGCMLICNPLTVVGMVDIAQKDGMKAIAQNAAASSVGQMLVKYAAKKGVETINIVRRAEQVELLKSIGAKIVINSSDPDWEKQLREVSGKLGPTAFYDAVGGDISGKSLFCLAPGSELISYGKLSGQDWANINLEDLMNTGKKIKGYNVVMWKMGISKEQTSEFLGMINKDLDEGGKIFGSTISKTFKLADWQDASNYAKEHTLEGKVVINPNK